MALGGDGGRKGAKGSAEQPAKETRALCQRNHQCPEWPAEQRLMGRQTCLSNTLVQHWKMPRFGTWFPGRHPVLALSCSLVSTLGMVIS